MWATYLKTCRGDFPMTFLKKAQKIFKHGTRSLHGKAAHWNEFVKQKSGESWRQTHATDPRWNDDFFREELSKNSENEKRKGSMSTIFMSAAQAITEYTCTRTLHASTRCHFFTSSSHLENWIFSTFHDSFSVLPKITQQLIFAEAVSIVRISTDNRSQRPILDTNWAWHALWHRQTPRPTPKYNKRHTKTFVDKERRTWSSDFESSKSYKCHTDAY